MIDALRAGWEAVDPDCDLLVTGEMGIGNTTSAAAIALALYGGQGGVTGPERAPASMRMGVALKSRVVAEGVARNPAAKGGGLEALRCIGRARAGGNGGGHHAGADAAHSGHS